MVVDGNSKLVGDMTFNDIRELTSDALGTGSAGSLFDKSIGLFEELRENAESYMTQAIKYSFPTSFKMYLTRPQWSTIGDASSG